MISLIEKRRRNLLIVLKRKSLKGNPKEEAIVVMLFNYQKWKMKKMSNLLF
jgi:hypothetical protein